MSLSVEIGHRFPGLELDVAFEAGAGVTALFGPSGAGKSSVVNAIAGLLRPDAGRIALDDTVLFDGKGACTCRRRAGASAMSFRTGGCFRI